LATETEVKVEIDDAGEFCRRLSALHPEAVSSRHFEDNHLLDFPDQRLGSSRCLLRVRSADGRHYLTFKGPPRPDGIFKTREELEITVEDGGMLLRMCERIGMHTSFRYQKYRREFACNGVRVAVDETPIGNYAEFEGSEAGIRELAQAMGIDEARFLRSSYYSLYLEYCREKNMPPGFMVFEDADR
jgi:predicted adenylyl cyclase CyaB